MFIVVNRRRARACARAQTAPSMGDSRLELIHLTEEKEFRVMLGTQHCQSIQLNQSWLFAASIPDLIRRMGCRAAPRVPPLFLVLRPFRPQHSSASAPSISLYSVVGCVAATSRPPCHPGPLLTTQHHRHLVITSSSPYHHHSKIHLILF